MHTTKLLLALIYYRFL